MDADKELFPTNGAINMKKFDSKIKRYLTVGGTALICVGAAALVLTFGTGAGAANQATVSSVESTSTEVSVPEIIVISQESSSGASAFVPSSGASAAASLTTILKPTSAPPEPTPPASSTLTDKNKKPSYSSKPTVAKKTTPAKASGTPKNGEVRNGKTWIDGFGWVEGTGKGGGTTTVVSGMHEGGEQVGIMD